MIWSSFSFFSKNFFKDQRLSALMFYKKKTPCVTILILFTFHKTLFFGSFAAKSTLRKVHVFASLFLRYNSNYFLWKASLLRKSKSLSSTVFLPSVRAFSMARSQRIRTYSDKTSMTEAEVLYSERATI